MNYGLLYILMLLEILPIKVGYLGHSEKNIKSEDTTLQMHTNIRFHGSKLQKMSLTRLSTAPTDADIMRRKRYLEECNSQKALPNFTLNTLIKNSADFRIKFPIDTVKTELILKRRNKPSDFELALENANLSYPIIHEKVIQLIINFLEHKRQYGSQIEKEIYKEMGIIDFVTRLLKKRAVQFVGRYDSYQLITGEMGHGDWEWVGTEKERSPQYLENCLSYDEIKISSLLAASSPSFFINSGNRGNCGVVNSKNDHQDWGIVIGAVGSRFEKKNFMEWQDMMITEDQNTKENGYGKIDNENFEGKSLYSNRADLMKIWAKFYDRDYFPVWNDLNDSYDLTNNFRRFTKSEFLDLDIYRKRCKIVAETLLLEANERGNERGKKVFLHVVGFGLGVWQISPEQEKIFLKGFSEAILESNLQNISDIYFSWFKEQSCDGITNGKTIGVDGSIKIHFGKRDPHDKLTNENKDKLLVVTYAWDGNALPGNEFWGGGLAESGDPAQACSSQIAELQNPHINPMMAGENLKIASPTFKKLLFLSEFVQTELSECVQTDQHLQLQYPKKLSSL